MYNLSIVIPICKPKAGWANNLVANALAVKKELSNVNIEFIVVNDGYEIPHLTSLFELVSEQYPFIQFISYEKNMGKGFALRTGVRAASAPYIVTTDIDFPYEHKNISQVYHKLLIGYDLVAGKRKADYFTRVPFKRLLISKGCTFLNRTVLRLPDCDCQSGLKGFNLAGKMVFLQTTINRFLVDTEFMVMGYRNKLKLSVVTLELKKGIEFSSMGMKVLVSETRNFISILLKKNAIIYTERFVNYERKENIPDVRPGRV